MKRVYKYQVSINHRSDILLPKGAEILSFQAQGETLQVWALVDAGADVRTERRRFLVYGTGHEINHPVEKLKYIGTSQMSVNRESLVLHLFEYLGD